jgi:two-component sensor histidine kinase
VRPVVATSDPSELAELVSGELVANALKHACISTRLTLTCTSSMLCVAMRDYLSTPVPQLQSTDIDAPDGRGLSLMTAVAHSWGTTQQPDGNTI